MKYRVTRGNEWHIKPCEEAFEEEFTWVEVRTCTSIEEFNFRFSHEEGEWLSEGVNHCINDEGYIQREFPNTKAWFIEINSLEELNAFAEKYNGVFIGDSYIYENIKRIEIS